MADTRNTSAPAPGSNGPAPAMAQGALVQAGRLTVQANPGDPNFPADIVARQQHPKSKQVETHPAHRSRNRANRSKRSNGALVLEAGAANAKCVDSAE
jgi:hypothetical protein